MDPTAILARVLDEPRVVRVRAVLDTYGRAAGGLLANGLAFSSMFAAIPTLLLVLGLAGIVANDPAVRDALSQALINAFPPIADLVEAALDALSKGAVAASLVGVIGLVWTVSQLYGALDVAFARIYAGIPERDIVRRTARGFLVVALLAVAIISLVVLATFAAAVDTSALGGIPFLSSVTSLVGSLPFMVGLAIVATLIVYHELPPRPPSWRSALVPAIVVGAAIVLLTQVFAFLVPRLVGVAALAGSLASAFVALAWLSFSFQALLYGAAWVRVREHGVAAPGVTPESAALGSPAAPAEPGGGGQ
jgi:YihY family inner membrane protein